MNHYRTTDMALAAYLNLHGHTHQKLEIRPGKWGPECVWVFRESEPLRILDESFLGGNAQVEPKTYLLKVAAVRQEMFDFLDNHNDG